MLIATIRSLAMQKMRGEIIEEEGFFELEVNVDMEAAKTSGDPKGFINKEVAISLQGCVMKTKIPLGEGVWSVEFSTFARTILEYPEGFVI